MADTRNQEHEVEGECALPTKRKRDLAAVTAEDCGGELPSKAAKNGSIDGVSDSQNAKSVNGGDNANGQEKNRVPEASDTVEAVLGEGTEEDEDDDEYGDDEESDEEEDDDDDDEEGEERPVDLKGKGILKEDKGKGKMIVEDDDDSDDSDDADLSDGGEAGSDSDSDLSDDPLAEVDLDNILPSRTRRSRAQPGLSIGGDRRSSSHGGDSNA